jgi:hypothetical protein
MSAQFSLQLCCDLSVSDALNKPNSSSSHCFSMAPHSLSNSAMPMNEQKEIFKKTRKNVEKSGQLECVRREFFCTRFLHSILVCASGNNAVPLLQQCEYSIRPRIVTSIVKNK